MAATPPQPTQIRLARRQLLVLVTALTERPLIALSFVWLALLVVDLTRGLPPVLQGVSTAIWIVFILDFALKLLIAPDKRRYLRRNWLTALALLLPALRVLRVARVVQVLRLGRAARTVNLLRMLTSLNRGTRALQRTVGQRGLLYLVPLTLLVALVGAAGIAQFESPASVRTENPGAAGTGIPSYGDAVWWTAMILTTFGSEYWPQTVEGRIVCWLLSLYALGVFGYITATLASHFVGTTTHPPAPPATADWAALRTELALLRRQLAEIQARLPAPTSRESPPDSGAGTREGPPHALRRPTGLSTEDTGDGTNYRGR